MSEAAARIDARPLVALICRVPVLSQGVADALESVANVHSFPADGGDTEGLLRWLEPDGVVVDCQEEADEAERFAARTDLPVVHVALDGGSLRVLQHGRWREPVGIDASPEGVRNVLIGGLFGRRQMQ